MRSFISSLLSLGLAAFAAQACSTQDEPSDAAQPNDARADQSHGEVAFAMATSIGNPPPVTPTPNSDVGGDGRRHCAEGEAHVANDGVSEARYMHYPFNNVVIDCNANRTAGGWPYRCRQRAEPTWAECEAPYTITFTNCGPNGLGPFSVCELDQVGLAYYATQGCTGQVRNDGHANPNDIRYCN